MDNFALRQIAKQRGNFNQNPPLAERENFPSVAAYRQYVDAPENEGTLVSTSQTGVTTAPKTFFGHTLSFLTAKSNAQEVETLKQSLEKDFGPHVAQYAFPHAEQEQAATSQWGGYVQEVTSKTLASALNPTLRGINLDVSLAERREEASPAMPFLQRQFRPVVQSAVRELNPALRNITLDVSLPTATPSVGLSHRLIKQVLERTNTLIANAPYIKKAAVAVEAIAHQLERLDDDVRSLPQDISTLTTNISGLAQDIADHPSNFPQAISSHHQELSELLATTTTAIPITLQKAHSIVLETRALAAALKKLKKEHDYDELGSSAPINLNAYNFEQFLEPVTTLLQEEATLAETVVRDLCTLPTSNGKASKLEAHLRQNDRISSDVKKYSQQVSKVKEKLLTELKTLITRSEKRLANATEAIQRPTIMTMILAFRGSWKEERDLAEQDLYFAVTTKDLIETSLEEARINLGSENIPQATAIAVSDEHAEGIPIAASSLPKT
ncbi:MAG: hypothetical protein K2W97_03140 [Chthoniobacterales bacterium]|nr:hypothetical protein [Chthoniobacterales bacterium]